MNGARRLVAVCNALDQHALPKGYIAAGKDAWQGGHQTIVDLEDAARSYIDALIAAEKRPVGLLANGKNHAVA